MIKEHIQKKTNPKGAAIFRKIPEDKMIICEHLRKGNSLSTLKHRFNFVKPLSTLEN